MSSPMIRNKPPRPKVCVSCGKEFIYGGSATKKLCPICNRKRLDVGKPKKKPLRTHRKASGEAQMFQEVWNTRPHVCVNCGALLGHEARAHYFAHILPKSTHPNLRLDPENIWILCIECHYAYDFQGKDKFLERKKAPPLV